MSKMSKKLPKILAIVFAVFVSIFALDVFDAGYRPLETIVALLIHLVPTYLILATLLIARKNEAVGGLVFILLGLSYIGLTHNRAHFDLVNYLVISGPCFLIGGLFLLSRIKDTKENG